MKISHLTSLAILPFAWGSMVPRQSEGSSLDLSNAQSTIQAAQIEGNVTALIHQLAISMDNALSADAASRQSASPISINAIIDVMYLNSNSPMNALAFKQATNIINSAGTNGSQTVGNAVEGVQNFVGGSIDGTSTIGDSTLNEGTITKSSSNAIPKALMDIMGKADEEQVQEFLKGMKGALDYLFKGFGTGISPVEYLVNDFVGTLEAFTVNVETEADKDPQELFHQHFAKMLDNIQERIAPLMRAYARAVKVPEAQVTHTVEILSRNFIHELSNMVDAFEKSISVFLHTPDPKDMVNSLLRARIIRTVGEVAIDLLKSITEHSRAINYMLYLANSVENTYLAAQTYMDDIESGLVADGPLHALLSNKNEMTNMITGLERTSESMANTLGNLMYTFLISVTVPDYTVMPKKAGLPEQDRSISPTDIWFQAAEKIAANIQKSSPFFGTLLKKGLALAETIYQEDPNILTNELSIANTISAMQAILDGLIAFLMEKQL